MSKYFVMYVDCMDDQMTEKYIEAESEDDIMFQLAEAGHWDIEIFPLARVEAIYKRMTDPTVTYEPLAEN